MGTAFTGRFCFLDSALALMTLSKWNGLMDQTPYRDLTTNEIEDFARDGVICLRGIYSTECINLLAKELDAIRERGVLGTGIKVDGSYYEWMQNDVIRDFVLFGPTAKPVPIAAPPSS